MICYVCNADEKFESLKEMNPERELLVCKDCGNVCYRVEPTDMEKVKNYYRHEYRPAPNFNNLLTTTNKRNYVRIFLKDFLKKRAPDVAGRPMVTTDIGCATGYLVDFLRGLGHRATGCELTLTFRRFAEHYYGIPVTEEIEKKHKYDLITIYHVLEHLPEPDKKLKEYADCLAEDGHMLIATPEWFDVLEEASGSEIQDFVHLFHKDHINVFSSRSLKNLFAKAGLVIVKEDHEQYGQTYLVRKVSVEKGETLEGIVREDPAQRIADIRRAKAAIDAYKARDYNGAISLWPKFPEAHLKMVFETNGKDPEAQAQLFEAIRPILGDNHRVLRGLAVWLQQQERFADAIAIIDQILAFRPAADLYLWKAQALAGLGRLRESMAAMEAASQLDPRRWQEAMNWLCALSVKMPAWDERAIEKLKETLLKQSGAAPKLLDPLMDPEAAEKKRAAATA